MYRFILYNIIFGQDVAAGQYYNVKQDLTGKEN